MSQYPQELPANTVQSLIQAALNPSSVEAPQLVHDLWWVTGYLAKTAIGDPIKLKSMVMNNVAQLNELEQNLIKLKNEPVHSQLKGMNVDWQIVLQGLLAIALTLFEKARK